MNRNLIFFNAEITPIRKLLLMHVAAGGKLTEYTVTGNPVTFDTNVAKPLSECLLSFLPVQSGTGDPSPENIRPVTGWTGAKTTRSGKNMYSYNGDNVKQETLYSGSTLTGTRAVYHTGVYGDGSTTFSLYAKRKDASVGTGRNINYGWFYGGNAYLKNYFIKETEELNPTTTVPLGAELVFSTTNDSVSTMQGNIQKYDIQIEIGSSATTFEEYTGESVSVTFPALGSNLCPPLTKGIGLAATTGKETEDVTKAATDYIPVSFANGAKYTLSGISDQLYSSVWAYNAQKQGLGRIISSQRTSVILAANSFTSGTPQGTGEIAYIRFQQAEHTTGNSINLIDNCDYMLNTGETAKPYEPYNTAYGGTVDPTTGVLTVEWVGKKVSDFSWNYQTYSGANVFRSTEAIEPKSISGKVLASDKLKSLNAISSWSSAATFDNYSVSFYNSSKYILIKDTDTTDVDSFLEQFGEAQLLYELSTPLVYQLTPQQIETLIGTNVLWSDLNGDMEVKYLKKG